MGSDLKLPIIPLLQHDAGCTLCLCKFWGFIFASEVSVCSLWIYGNTCQRYPQDPAAAERKNLGRDWCGEESLIARHEHRASQDCPVERLCSLLATISSIPYQILFLRRDSSVLWKWEPSSSALCGGRCDPTRRTELASLFMEILFFLFCFVSFFFFPPPNLQSLSICLCRRINLWYALYIRHFVTFFAWHPEGTAMRIAHAVSTTNKLRPREYASKKAWDISAIKTPKLDLKPLYVREA